MPTAQPLTGTARAVADRYLLSEATTGFPKQAILIASGDSSYDRSHEVTLSVIAPGLRSVNDVRMHLKKCLAAALPMMYPNWVHKVELRPNEITGEMQVVVEIDDPEILGSRSAVRILGVARAALEAKARHEYWRNVVTLRSGQRLVPLSFEFDELRRQSMELILPAGLEFVQPSMLRFDYYPEGHLPKALAHFEHALKLALDTGDDLFKPVHHVAVNQTTKGVAVGVGFRTYPAARCLNAVQRAVTRVVQDLARPGSDIPFFRDLVFTSAQSFSDPDGDYNEESGFLGEYDEY